MTKKFNNNKKKFPKQSGGNRPSDKTRGNRFEKRRSFETDDQAAKEKKFHGGKRDSANRSADKNRGNAKNSTPRNNNIRGKKRPELKPRVQSKPVTAKTAQPSMASTMGSKPERIAKVLAHAGLCSRREAEAWIVEGRVSVDGEVLKTPARVVTSANQIMVNGRKFFWKAKDVRAWMYHKPAGLVVTHKDPQGRPNIFEQLPKSLPRVVSVGRLDLNSEGLLLLTNDGGLARYLELPQTGLQRHYRVRVYGEVAQYMIDQLANGVFVDGIRYAPIRVEIEKSTGRNAWLFVTLAEGKNREIRKVMEHFGLQVNRLMRHAYGPFELRDLGIGKVKEITQDQLHRLLPGYFNRSAN